MNKLTAIALAGASVILAGCESVSFLSGSKQTEPAPAEIATVNENGDPRTLGALTASTLPKGECGMVLWTLDADKPVPVFRYVSGKSAEIAIGEAVISLQRVSSNGASAFGVFESQQFKAANGMDVSVDVRFSLGFDGGNYLERGLITVETAESWRIVSPTAGLAGCRTS